MSEGLLNERAVEIQFLDSPLVEVRPLLREPEDKGRERPGFWARQWRKMRARS